MLVTLVRHTRPDVASDVCYGSTDLELADSFRAESDQVIQLLNEHDRLVSSPLQRCRKLAEAIGHALGLDMQIDERLREMDFGSWEGKRWSAIAESEVALWRDDFMHARPHGGESVAMLRDRTRAALCDYQIEGTSTIIVTHSGVIKAALASGDTAADFDAHIDFGGIVELLPQDKSK